LFHDFNVLAETLQSGFQWEASLRDVSSEEKRIGMWIDTTGQILKELKDGIELCEGPPCGLNIVLTFPDPIGWQQAMDPGWFIQHPEKYQPPPPTMQYPPEQHVSYQQAGTIGAPEPASSAPPAQFPAPVYQQEAPPAYNPIVAQPHHSSNSKFCGQCGAKNAGSNFCAECGTKF